MAKRLELRVINDDGATGRAVGNVTLSDDRELTYSGSAVARAVLESIAQRRRVNVDAAFDLVYDAPWSNAKLVLQPARELRARQAPTEREERRARVQRARELLNDDYVRDEKGRFAKHAALKSALEAMGGQYLAYDFGDEGSDRYADWSSRTGENYGFEIGNEDGEAVSMLLYKDELRLLANEMGRSILRREKPETDPAESKQSAIFAAMLTEDNVGGAVNFADGDPTEDYESKRYVDFSYSEDNEQPWTFEIGTASDDSIQVHMTNDEFDALYASLALTLATDYPDG